MWLKSSCLRKYYKYVMMGFLFCLFPVLSGCALISEKEASVTVTDVKENHDETVAHEKETAEELDRKIKDTIANTGADLVEVPVLITPTSISNIEMALFSEDIFCIYDGEFYGYINRKGEEITSFVYDLAYPFSEGLACAMIDGSYGFVDTNGQVAIPFNYLDAAPFSEGLAYFAGEESYGFLNKDGSVAFTLNCDSVSSFREGLAYVCIDGKYGYIDQNGQSVIEPQYQNANYFKDGLALVENSGLFALINKTGEEVIPLRYDEIMRYDKYIIAEIEERYDYYNSRGERIPEEEYEAAIGRETLPDTENVDLLKENYSYVHVYDNGKIRVGDGQKYGIANEDSSICVPIEYEDVRIFEDGSYSLKKEGIIEIYDCDGNWIYSFQEESYTWLSMQNGYYRINNENILTLLDKQGNVVLSVDYDMENPVYGDFNSSILSCFNDDVPDQILMVGDSECTDITAVLLQNRITPGNELYWKLSHGKYVNMIDTEGEMQEVRKYHTWDESNYIKRFKLYDFDNSKNPILYCMEEPCFHPNFPLTDSAFFAVHDGLLYCLLTGYECGGSLRGDYVCFWRDGETGEVYPGTRGSAGGFGGYSSWGSVYNYENGVLNPIASFQWVGQTSGNYTEEELLENAHLFYNENDIPYTRDNIKNAEHVNEYLVNDKQAPVEEYQKLYKKYLLFDLFE